MAKVTTHVYEPIDAQKELRGNSRRGSDAPPEVQQKIIDIIIEEARKRQFNNRYIAYYIAIVKRESGFNPDAANEGSTASGVSQIQDDTGKHLGLNDKNRFNARSNIQAGLDFFSEIKEKIKKDYGSVAGKFEVLIYYCYHYGMYSVNHRETVNGKVIVKEPYPFSQLENNAKYNDSKTVVDEAARIEKILDDNHGIKIQLFDVLGKAMAGRKVVVVQKVAKEMKENDGVTTPATAPTTSATMSPTAAPSLTTTQNTNSISDMPSTAPRIDANESTIDPVSAATAATPVQIEWELKAVEVTTDANGNLPEIETENQAAVMVLIPRIEYEAYNDAVAKQEITEEGNRHHFKSSAGEQGALPTIKANQESTANQNFANPAKPLALVKTPSASNPKKLQPPTNPFDAIAQGEAQAKIPKPSAGADISFDDIRHALQTHLGWANVFETSFAYVKEFFTRPKLPAQPLNPDVATKKSPARTQTIGSSAKNAEVKLTKVKDALLTSVEGTVKTVEMNENAPWMAFALAEQTRTQARMKEFGLIRLEKAFRPDSDENWLAEKNTRNTAKSEIGRASDELRKEKQKKENLRDKNKISELEKKIKAQENIYAVANTKMLEIEKQYNDEDIVKYLQSTSLSNDMARDDSTAWCSAFANWCVEQTKYHGSRNAKADSWLTWGEEIKEPRYGAIAVVTRGLGKYHVGFLLHIGKKNVPDGEEEIEVKGKDGKMTKRMKKKYREVEVVRLLSGNQTDQIKEDSEWTVNPAESAKHLVSYRWPTNKELKK